MSWLLLILTMMMKMIMMMMMMIIIIITITNPRDIYISYGYQVAAVRDLRFSLRQYFRNRVRCDSLSLISWFPTFRTIVVPSRSQSISPGHLECCQINVKALRSFEASRTARPTTLCHV